MMEKDLYVKLISSKMGTSSIITQNSHVYHEW